ncbi:hypothetical protein GC176_15765 [bacterium]|nr:hypothetical protein [bacterium]
MRTQRLADADYAERIRGSLGTTLIQITQNGNRPQTRPAPHAAVPGFAEWQQQWQTNNRLISQRLAMIDAELERMTRDEMASPQLNVFQDVETVS